MLDGKDRLEGGEEVDEVVFVVVSGWFWVVMVPADDGYGLCVRVCWLESARIGRPLLLLMFI